VYACKVIRTANTGLSAEETAREAAAIRSLCTTNNPFMLELLSDWEEGDSSRGQGAWFFVMELMDTNLEAHMSTLAMNYTLWDFYVRMLSKDLDVYVNTDELLSAVEHVHSLGYVHRDIKPSNGTSVPIPYRQQPSSPISFPLFVRN
jgi:serine/threonine protein kinase